MADIMMSFVEKFLTFFYFTLKLATQKLEAY